MFSGDGGDTRGERKEGINVLRKALGSALGNL